MAETFPVKPKLRPTANRDTPTTESKFWKSFKTPKHIQSESLTFPITSLAFSPTAPHDFAACHSVNVSIFSGKTLESRANITGFNEAAASAAYRSDGRLLAVGDLTGAVKVFDVSSRTKSAKQLRRLRAHKDAVRLVRYPIVDKFHLFTGGDDSIVNYWDVAAEKCLFSLLGHKDYVRCGDVSPVSDDMFVSGSYDSGVRVWDVRVSNRGSVMELKHEKPVESVIYLPSGGLVATASGNFVKIWDVIGGGRLLHSMESHNKTVTSLCMGKVGRDVGEEAEQYRILSVGLDGYMKVFDYAKFKVTYSMRFMQPLMSVGFAPDCSTRVIGTTKGNVFIGSRKAKKLDDTIEVVGDKLGFGNVEDEPQRTVLRPTYFRYFQRGQNVKPLEGDYLVGRPKKVKFADYDKLLKKFRHKDAFVAALKGKNPENVVAVIEELVARKKLIKCVSNLEMEELGVLLGFLQKYSTVPRYAGLLMKLANKVVELRAEEIKSSDILRGHIRNFKRDVEEEIRIKQSLLEIQGIISPMMKITAKTNTTLTNLAVYS